MYYDARSKKTSNYVVDVSIPYTGNKFCLPQAEFGPHSSSYSVGTEGIFFVLWGKTAGAWSRPLRRISRFRMCGAVDFIPPRFFMACTQFNLHFYEDGTVCLRGLIRVQFKGKLLRKMKGGVLMFKRHAMKTCMGVELRHSFRAEIHRFRKI